MKVLQMSKLYPPFWGGIETVVYDLSVKLKEEGVDVDVLCVSENDQSSEEVIDGIRVFRCASLFHLSSVYFSLLFMRKWLEIRNDYDIIHVHLPNPLAILCLFFIRTNAKIVVHWHSDIVKQKFLKIPFIPLQNWLLKRCSSVIATSPKYASYSKDLSDFKDKISVIPIGINENALMEDEDVKLNIFETYKGKKIVFSLGRHIYYKGFDFLIDSAKYLQDDTVVLIGGTGELSDGFRQKIMQSGLKDKVYLLGKIPQEQLGSYYGACDVFCLPSIERSEAFGVVQIEAMSFGKPVISTNIEGSGVDWVNRNDITGKIVPIKNSKSLANAINEVVSNNNFDRGNILDYFKQNFLRDKMAKKTLDLYKEVIR